MRLMGKHVKTKPSPKPIRKRVSPRGEAASGFRVLHLLSDSTGNLANHMVSAFVTQFAPATFSLQRRPFLSTHERVEREFTRIQAEPGIVLHAMINPPLKNQVAELARKLSLPCRDLTGGFVEFLEESSGTKASPNLQHLHHMDEDYQRRLTALEFTLEHDDGCGLTTIHEADIVLAGVSRTSKTPTSVYLSQQGYRVANVSLVHGIVPPPQLLQIPSGKVAGLLIDPVRLADIRSRRQSAWQMAPGSYDDINQVQRELIWSKRLFASQGWPTIDVTDQAIEETAARILQILGLFHGTGAR